MVITVREQLLQQAASNYCVFHTEIAYEKMKCLVLLDEPLNESERHLLSSCYREILHVRRDAVRRLLKLQATQLKQQAEAEAVPGLLIEQQRNEADEQRDKQLMDLIEQHRNLFLSELDGYVGEMIDLLKEHLLPRAGEDVEAHVMYLKLLADSYQCLAEFAFDENRQLYGKEALHTYVRGYFMATTHLPPSHPLLLSTALNYSVLFYEIFDDIEAAIRVAKVATQDCTAEELEQAGPYSAEAAHLIGLLEKNLGCWVEKALAAGQPIPGPDNQ